MFRFLLNRLLQSIVALIAIISITFFLARAAPGGPFLEEKAIPPHIVKQMEAYYGLDKPLPVQWLTYMGNFIQGDLGPSFGNKGYTVNEVIAQGLPVSLTIGLGGLLIALGIGVPIGIIAAARQNQFADYSLMSLAMMGICLPTFVTGPLLSIYLGIKFGWFNATGWNEPSDWFLPSLTLGVFYAAYIARLSRGGILDILRQDYVRTARAKGVPEWRIMVRHTLRGGLLPVVIYLGPAISGLISGSFIVENIFELPGLGTHFIVATTNRDYTLILGTVAVYAVLILTMNFLVDIAQVYLNPRLRSSTAPEKA